jgi:hypothetical protein
MSTGLLPGYYLGYDDMVFRHTANGAQLVYIGSQTVVQMVSVGGGVDTLFSGGNVYFSPNGANIGGCGKTVLANSGYGNVESIIGVKTASIRS